MLRGYDGALRDLSSVHGTYRAIQLAAAAMRPLAPCPIRWLLDQLVSNSGRLAVRLRELGSTLGVPWTAEVVFNPDRELAGTSGVVVTADSVVHDHAGAWFKLAALALKTDPPRWLLNLSTGCREDKTL